MGTYSNVGWQTARYLAPVIAKLREGLTQSINATGIAPTIAFGDTSIDLVGDKLYPTGWTDWAFGTPTAIKAIRPASWNSLIFQNFTVVKNYIRYINAFPFTGQPITPPSPKVYNLLQFLRPTGTASLFVAGTARVSNYYRWVYANGLAVVHTFGTTKVNLGRRYITNVYISTTLTDFGTPFTAWENRDITPTGFAAGGFGTLLIKEKAQRCYPTPRLSTLVFGVPTVKERTQRFYPFALDSNLYGTGFVYNLKQEITPASILQWEFESDRFGYYNNVFTKNKKIATNGYVDSRFSISALVYNGARRVSPWATIPMTRYGTAFIAPRVRSFGVAWYTQEVFGTPYVRTRKVIGLDGWGWHSMKFGIPSRVWSNLQTIKPFATYEQTEYGRQWVSQGLRDLRPSSILTQPTGTPFVSFDPRYISPAGISQGYMGTVHIETHYNVINLWGYTSVGYGVPSVRNVTPEIRAYSTVALLPGVPPKVMLMKRYLRNPATQNTGVVGTPFVSDRMRRIRPPSPDYLRWGNGLVQFDQSQLVPPQQTIAPESIQGGAGAIINTDWDDPGTPYTGAIIPFGAVKVKLNTIFAPSLGLLDTFGTPFTRSMVILANPGPAPFVFGAATILGGTKWVRVGGGPLASAVEAPRVIGGQYVRVGQARDAGTSTWVPASFHTTASPDQPWYAWAPQSAGPTFGSRTTLTLQHRRIYPSGSRWDALGTNIKITTRPQYIRPAGINSYKRGMPDVSYVGIKVIYAGPWSGETFGTLTLVQQDFGPKWVYPSGLPSPGFGTTYVMLKHRRVYPFGIYQFASPKGAQYIGPYLRIYAKPGLDHSSFGTLYIDHKHRRIYQLDVTDDTPPWQTSRATKVIHQARGYFVDGTDFGVQFGVSDVGYRVKQVMPTGWEEFETGFSYVPTSYPGLSKLNAQAFITQPYTSTMEFGNGAVAHQ